MITFQLLTEGALLRYVGELVLHVIASMTSATLAVLPTWERKSEPAF
jgi:hypothetical protein